MGTSPASASVQQGTWEPKVSAFSLELLTKSNCCLITEIQVSKDGGAAVTGSCGGLRASVTNSIFGVGLI